MAVSKAIVAKLEREGRMAARPSSSSTTAWTWTAMTTRGVLHAARGVRLPRGHAARRRGRPPGARERPRDPARGLALGARACAHGAAADRRRGVAARTRSRPRRSTWGCSASRASGDACVGTRHARPGAAVVFTGRREDVPAFTAALDVAVLPSYREAQGLVILEAMALGGRWSRATWVASRR